MYGHVIEQWVDKLVTEGVREVTTAIRHDVVRGMYFSYVRCRLKKYVDIDTDDITKVYVDPDDVHWVSTAPWSMLVRNGEDAVIGTLTGSWDRFRVPLEETDTYRRIEDAYRAGEHELISSIRRNGYREADPETGDTRTIRDIELPDEIRLAVGRNGEFIQWSGGRHRLSAAQLLEIERVPAYIVLWHADAVREDIINEYAVGSNIAYIS